VTHETNFFRTCTRTRCGNRFRANAAAAIVSPEVQPDHRVTFRFRAPKRKKSPSRLRARQSRCRCKKTIKGNGPSSTDPLAPDYYGYSFITDGVGLLDPSNYRTKPNFLYRANELYVPGPASLTWEISEVPHGEIHQPFL